MMTRRFESRSSPCVFSAKIVSNAERLNVLVEDLLTYLAWSRSRIKFDPTSGSL